MARLERRPGWRPEKSDADDENDAANDLVVDNDKVDEEDDDASLLADGVSRERSDRERVQQLLAERAAGRTAAPPPALAQPAAPWLSPVKNVEGQAVYGGEEGVPLPEDGGDMSVLPVGARGAKLKMPEKDFDAWMSQVAPLLLNFPSLYKIQILRTAPSTTKGGTFCDGSCGEVRHPIDTEYIRENFGGWKYDIKLLGPAKNEQGETVAKFLYLRSFYGVRVPGDPIIPGQQPEGRQDERRPPARKSEESMQAKLQAPAPPPPPGPGEALLTKLVESKLDSDKRLENEAREMRGQLMKQQQPAAPLVSPALAASDGGAASMLFQQLQQMQQTNERLQQMVLDVVRERPEAPPPPPPTDTSMPSMAIAALVKALETKGQATAPLAPADKEETARLHAMVETLQRNIQDANESRRKEIEELTRGFRTETDALRRQYDKQIDDMRVQQRDEMSSARSDARTQAESQVGMVRQQYEGLLATVRQGYDDRIRIIQEQLDDYRGQTMDTRGKLATAESEAQRARLDEIVAKTRAEIASAIPKREATDEVGGLTKMVATFKTVRDVVDTISPAAAPVANPAPAGVVDRILGIGEKVAGSPQAAKMLEVVLDRVGQRAMARQQARQQAQQQAQQQAVQQPSAAQVDEASRAWAEEQEKQRAVERRHRDEARAREQARIPNPAPRYQPLGTARMESLEQGEPESSAEGSEALGERPILAVTAEAASRLDAMAAAGQATTAAGVAEEMGLSAEVMLAAIEQAAAVNMPPEKFVGDLLKASYGFSLEEAAVLLADIDPKAALAELGISRDALSLSGGAYFDRVREYMTSTLHAARPPAAQPPVPATEPPAE